MSAWAIRSKELADRSSEPTIAVCGWVRFSERWHKCEAEWWITFAGLWSGRAREWFGWGYSFFPPLVTQCTWPALPALAVFFSALYQNSIPVLWLYVYCDQLEGQCEPLESRGAAGSWEVVLDADRHITCRQRCRGRRTVDPQTKSPSGTVSTLHGMVRRETGREKARKKLSLCNLCFIEIYLRFGPTSCSSNNLQD